MLAAVGPVAAAAEQDQGLFGIEVHACTASRKLLLKHCFTVLVHVRAWTRHAALAASVQ